ncbi:MAG: hypothetical protein ACRC2T_16290 [Thermoguttaceae bacterium]
MKVHLLQHHFFIEDIPVLAKEYETKSKEVKAEIERISQEHLSFLIQKKVSCSFGLLSLLFSKSEITEESKISLLINSLANLEPEQAKACFEQLGMTDYASLFEGKRPKFARDDTHAEQLLPILQNRNWITFKVEGEGKESYYQAIGKKITKSEKERN